MQTNNSTELIDEFNDLHISVNKQQEQDKQYATFFNIKTYRFTILIIIIIISSSNYQLKL